ncbi:MAG TPA: acyl-CoA dehydrogenase family protein, partial [Steroidobacteraceae bacterium]|nr:acyl-CoA dehydrogenase family protein [Steroidobacteraceae bacterium]
MGFQYSPKVQDLMRRIDAFMQQHVYPAEHEYQAFVEDPANRWVQPPLVEPLKAKAREAGLWNLFLPHESAQWSPGLTNLEYAPLAELMGRVEWAPEVFNCSAPDTGNMEVLARYGTPEQQQRWLAPLLEGRIRSAFLMTEPGVASSDATNIECSIVRDGDEYVIDGRKWWSSNAYHPHCEILIVMGKTRFDG